MCRHCLRAWRNADPRRLEGVHERYRGGHTTAGPRSREDLERATHGFQPLIHADQAEAFIPGCIDIKSHAVVDDAHRERIAEATHTHRYLGGAAVLDRILERFLNDSEQTQGELGRQLRWNALVRE